MTLAAAEAPRSRWPAPVRAARAAFVFLSRLPVGGFPYSADEWRWAAAHFPLVGVVIGAFGAGVYAAAHGLGSSVAAVLALTTTVLLTGAFHEDGLADTADAMGGAHGAKGVLEILKDSRVGSYGGTALVLTLLLRVSCLSQLGVMQALPALVLSHTFARTGPVWLMTTLPYVSLGAQAKGSSVAAASTPQAVVASIWALACGAAIAALDGGWWAAVSAAALAVASVNVVLRAWFRARVGGFTGDFLGAAEQVGESAVLLCVLGCVA